MAKRAKDIANLPPAHGKGSPIKPSAARPSTFALQDRFLRQFAIIGNVTSAAKLTGISVARHYEWLHAPEKFPDYELRFRQAKAEAIDAIRTAVIQRGVYGWEEPVYGSRVDANGKSLGTGVVGHVRKFSDRILELAATANVPEYRKKLELSGPEGGPIQTQHLAGLSDEQLRERLEMLQQILKAAPPGPPALALPAAAVDDGAAAAYAEALKRRNGDPEKKD